MIGSLFIASSVFKSKVTIYGSFYIDTEFIKVPLSSIYYCKNALIHLSSNLISKLLVCNNNIVMPDIAHIKFKNNLCNINFIDLLNTCYVWEFVPKVYTNMHFSYMFSGSYLLYLSGLLTVYLMQPCIIIFIDKSIAKFDIINSIRSKFYFYGYSFSNLRYIIIPIFAIIKPVYAELYFHGISLSHFNRYCASLISLSYILFGGLFDYYMHRIYVRGNLNLNFFTYMMCGFFYSFSILVGIFFTNSLWALMHNNLLNNLTAGLAFIIPTVVFSGAWFSLRTSSAMVSNDGINSLLRQLTETVAFICICTNTYGTWNLFTQAMNNTLLSCYIGIPLGLVIHLISGHFLIGLELNDGNFLYYGILYWFWWSGAIFNTNSLVYLFSYLLPYPQYMYTWVSVILISFSSVILNYPQYFLYAVSNSVNNSPQTFINRAISFFTRNRYIIVVRLYITILSYCIYGGLLWAILMDYFI